MPVVYAVPDGGGDPVIERVGVGKRVRVPECDTVSELDRVGVGVRVRFCQCDHHPVADRVQPRARQLPDSAAATDGTTDSDAVAGDDANPVALTDIDPDTNARPVTAPDRGRDVTRLVAAHLPDAAVVSVSRLGEGWDNVTYEVNGEIIVRFSKVTDERERAALVQREERILRMVARLTAMPVPRTLFISLDDGCIAYLKIAGISLLEASAAARATHATTVGAALGVWLKDLHAAPVDEAMDAGVDAQQMDGWLADAATSYSQAGGTVPSRHRGAIEDFLHAQPPERGDTLVFSHNDLGADHVIADPSTWEITGVIDWTDAARVDPAVDFGYIYRDLGPRALDAMLDGYAASDAARSSLRDRAAFYARCSVLEDLAYGVAAQRDVYIAQAVASLEWLFPHERVS